MVQEEVDLPGAAGPGGGDGHERDVLDDVEETTGGAVGASVR